MGALSRHLGNALRQAWQNDLVNTAKAAAYSGMLMLFPAFLVLTTLLALVPQGNTLLDVIRSTAEQFLPADTMSLLQSYFLTRRAYSLQVMFSAITLSTLAGLGLMLSIMEGFRRAYRLPRNAWSFWERQLRALLLLPISLVPLSLATLLLIFGHSFEIWMIENSAHGMLVVVVLLWRLARWTLALITSITVLGAVYHFGTHSKEHWRCVLPGSIAATFLWFPATLAFGWYVTRVADYSMLYGSLGTGIATLVWLYMTSFSVLLGAELNGVLFRERHTRAGQKLPLSVHPGNPLTDLSNSSLPAKASTETATAALQDGPL